MTCRRDCHQRSGICLTRRDWSSNNHVDETITGLDRELTFAESIRLAGVCFGYEDEGKQTISNLDIEIFKGEKIGIIGATGSGKSTLIDIIMGLLSPSEGQLIVDGQALNASNIKLWRNCDPRSPS